MTGTSNQATGGPSEFEGRKSEVWDAVMNFRDSERQLETGQILLHRNEACSGLFQLVEGWLVICDEEQDFPRIAQFGLPGTIIGCRDETAAFSVQAISAARVSILPAANLMALSLEHPGMGERLRSLAARPYTFAFQRTPAATILAPRERIGQMLLELFIRARAQWPNHTAQDMRLPLSDDHVVAASGVNIAGDILCELQKEGILSLDRNGIAVLDPDRLVDAAGTELRTMRTLLLS